eukprot:TRINITY_DN5393_c0_g2_i1.p2 TRINITY_DN5393_c0_g2~~TRINITY_DN5393_c0_g2_i1.p2  ORF type:complete len:173 (-),score=13.00 TRINITY_DN5393_c0_g2_i1:56-574(-)
MMLQVVNKRIHFQNMFLMFQVQGIRNLKLKISWKKKVEELYNNESKYVELMRDMGSNAPAFGMAGTLIGLILLLSQLSDPSSIGPGMSLALITTLYGVLFARLYCMPIANKLYNLAEINLKRRSLYLEGIILIMQKKSTFYIEDKLNSFQKLDQINLKKIKLILKNKYKVLQ